MSPNVALIRGIYDAFSRGDIADVLGRMSPGIVWNEAENFPYADGNPYIGPQAVASGIFATGRRVGHLRPLRQRVGRLRRRRRRDHRRRRHHRRHRPLQGPLQGHRHRAEHADGPHLAHRRRQGRSIPAARRHAPRGKGHGREALTSRLKRRRGVPFADTPPSVRLIGFVASIAITRGSRRACTAGSRSRRRARSRWRRSPGPRPTHSAWACVPRRRA